MYLTYLSTQLSVTFIISLEKCMLHIYAFFTQFSYLFITICFTLARGIHLLTVSLILYSQLTNFLIIFKCAFFYVKICTIFPTMVFQLAGKFTP